MNGAKHTPGPWQTHPAIPSLVVSKNLLDVASCSHPGGRADSPETRANARLIAETPNLLAACKAADELFRSIGQIGARDLQGVLDQALEIMCKGRELLGPVIAKAEGQ